MSQKCFRQQYRSVEPRIYLRQAERLIYEDPWKRESVSTIGTLSCFIRWHGARGILSSKAYGEITDRRH